MALLGSRACSSQDPRPSVTNLFFLFLFSFFYLSLPFSYSFFDFSLLFLFFFFNCFSFFFFLLSWERRGRERSMIVQRVIFRSLPSSPSFELSTCFEMFPRALIFDLEQTRLAMHCMG